MPESLGEVHSHTAAQLRAAESAENSTMDSPAAMRCVTRTGEHTSSRDSIAEYKMITHMIPLQI